MIDRIARLEDALALNLSSRVEAFESQFNSVRFDFTESLRVERSVADTKHSVQEEFFGQHQRLAISKLNDMAGCIQDRFEHRLQGLHATLHEPNEEVQLRVDTEQHELNALKEKHERVEARAALLGVVISSCVATARACPSAPTSSTKIRISYFSTLAICRWKLGRSPHRATR